MASKAIRKQHYLVALLEGFCLMMGDQGASDDEQFSALAKRVSELRDEMGAILRAEPNGMLTNGDIKRIMASVEVFKANTFIGREFAATEALSMLVCLIVDQLAMVQNDAKRRCLEAMLAETENLMAWADPEWVYAGDDGYKAANLFEGLEV